MLKSEAEIENVLNDIEPDAAAGGQSRWPGMTYEQGVDAALRWVLGDADVSPMED